MKTILILATILISSVLSVYIIHPGWVLCNTEYTSKCVNYCDMINMNMCVCQYPRWWLRRRNVAAPVQSTEFIKGNQAYNNNNYVYKGMNTYSKNVLQAQTNKMAFLQNKSETMNVRWTDICTCILRGTLC